MKIIVDTDKREVVIPQEFKSAFDKLSKELGSKDILSFLNVSSYKIMTKQTRVKSDRTNAMTIQTFMEGVKDTDKEIYKEYITLRDAKVGETKNGKPIKTNFLTLKKWFYSKYPEQNPLRKA